MNAFNLLKHELLNFNYIFNKINITNDLLLGSSNILNKQ